jgi:Uma2 family endonuclease
MSTASLSETAPVWAFESGVSLNRAHEGNRFPTTMAEIWMRTGKVPLDRILTVPAPGAATVDDAIHSKERFDLSCELVAGTLVAKTMGYFESKVAAAVGYFFHRYLDDHPIGEVAVGDGPCETIDENIRKPDVSYTAFDPLPFSPDLAVEVLSPSNTVDEMEKKLHEYFASGAKLVWHIEPELKTARVYTAIDRFEDIPPTGTLRGGDVLPGFELTLARLFEKAGPRMEE